MASLWGANAWEAVTLPSGLGFFVKNNTREARWHLPAGATVTQAAPWTLCGIPAGESAWKQLPNSEPEYSTKKPKQTHKRGKSTARRRAKKPKVKSDSKQTLLVGEPPWEAMPKLPIVQIFCIGTRAASDAAMEMAMHQVERSRSVPLPIHAGRRSAEAWSQVSGRSGEQHAGGQANAARAATGTAKKRKKRAPRAPKAGKKAKGAAAGAKKKPRTRKKATPQSRAKSLAAAAGCEAKAAAENALAAAAAPSAPTAIGATRGADPLSRTGDVHTSAHTSAVRLAPGGAVILNAQAPATQQALAVAVTSAPTVVPRAVFLHPSPAGVLAAIGPPRLLSSDARGIGVAEAAAREHSIVTAVATGGDGAANGFIESVIVQ